MIFILAGCFAEAEDGAKAMGLQRSEWRCLHNVNQTRGDPNAAIFLWGGWRGNPLANRGDVLDQCREIGVQIRERVILRKGRKQKAAS